MNSFLVGIEKHDFQQKPLMWVLLAMMLSISISAKSNVSFVMETLYAPQDTFPTIVIDTTESEIPIEFTGTEELGVDTLSSSNSISEFEKKINAHDKGRRTRGKSNADALSTPYLVNGEILASHVDAKTKAKRKRLWKEIDPGDEIRRQMENSKTLLEKYEKNLKLGQSIENDRLVDAMKRKIDYTKRLIKEQKRSLKNIK